MVQSQQNVTHLRKRIDYSFAIKTEITQKLLFYEQNKKVAEVLHKYNH